MKIRMTLALLALAGLATLGSTAPAPVYREPPKPKVPELFAALQGTWEVEQNVNINNAMRARGIVAIKRIQQRIRIQGTSWGYIFNNNGTEIESTKYQMVLDPKAAPATLDLETNQNVMVFGGLGGGQAMVKQTVMKGIIKVEGDTLTFCYVYGHQQNAERPKQFFAGNQVMVNGTTAMTMRLKRVK